MPATSLHQFRSALSDAPTIEAWRWQVRRMLSELRDLLAVDSGPYGGWLAAREAGMLRERNALLGRVAALGPQVLRDPSGDQLRTELRRLLVDVDRHLQRRRDLAWDEVELELGGSE